MEAKFKKGQLVIHKPTGKEYTIDSLNFKRYIVNKNGRTTGFQDEF